VSLMLLICVDAQCVVLSGMLANRLQQQHAYDEINSDRRHAVTGLKMPLFRRELMCMCIVCVSCWLRVVGRLLPAQRSVLLRTGYALRLVYARARVCNNLLD